MHHFKRNNPNLKRYLFEQCHVLREMIYGAAKLVIKRDILFVLLCRNLVSELIKSGGVFKIPQIPNRYYTTPIGVEGGGCYL